MRLLSSTWPVGLVVLASLHSSNADTQAEYFLYNLTNEPVTIYNYNTAYCLHTCYSGDSSGGCANSEDGVLRFIYCNSTGSNIDAGSLWDLLEYESSYYDEAFILTSQQTNNVLVFANAQSLFVTAGNAPPQAFSIVQIASYGAFMFVLNMEPDQPSPTLVKYLTRLHGSISDERLIYT